ncbi:MAG: FGGY family carbohydrate kinase [Bacteroidales bacterium]|nr:FGGY family carbohydrate kinase [Bacteroidales bacterium]MCL2133625.1 FGGY family carbohydrate kinase [Bacteroidales bacterium]
MKTLGIDVGSSSVKVALMDVQSGDCVASVTLPPTELPIEAVQSGWAEQDPAMWWEYVCKGIVQLAQQYDMREVAAIGISYQMHGLVCVDKEGKALRKSIIWCDSRAVAIGAQAFDAIGHDKCLAQTLNSPSNFTASKLAWVKEHEPEIFRKIHKFMLPGDYIAYMLSGEMSTTVGGLSEQILWDFKNNDKANFVADYYGIPDAYIPKFYPSLGIQAHTNEATERLLGIKKGTPLSYRAGDQPNNAFSLNVLDVGDVAATGGTSGVVYGVTDRPQADKLSRVNPFLHVNHSTEKPRLGLLLCINGTGILNAWIKRLCASEISYDEANALCLPVSAGSEGLVMLPFGNGAERMLENRFTGAEIIGIDLNRHTRAHVLRATQEGIAFAFRYGLDIMREMGVRPQVIRAGRANLFLSAIFRTTLSTICNVSIELYNTDGALGAARGAALGAGFYKNREEAFTSLKKHETIQPDPAIKAALEESYRKWKEELTARLSKNNER